jgi:hypothetical protein
MVFGRLLCGVLDQRDIVFRDCGFTVKHRRPDFPGGRPSTTDIDALQNAINTIK